VLWHVQPCSIGTPFAGGIFRMRLVLGKDFPAVPPKGYFLTKIFHPNVGHKGEICCDVCGPSTFFSLSRQTIKCLLIHPNPESALNEEAGRLLLEDYAEYESRAHPRKSWKFVLKRILKKNASPFGENYCHYFAKANIFLNVFFML
uniref:Ubiquitin-conjugating enzyme E2S n=1 Tax=Oryzias sinensis TaxID=183150 RepID=A0A8C7X0Q9_9TELE